MASAQDFYNFDWTYWQKSSGYLPAELKKYFTAVQKEVGEANRKLVPAPVLQGDFSAVKKSKSIVELEIQESYLKSG